MSRASDMKGTRRHDRAPPPRQGEGAPGRNLLIGATADEEADLGGATGGERAISRVTGVLIGEPSDLSVYIAEKGPSGWRLRPAERRPRGDARSGINAILQMSKVLPA